MEQKDCIFCKIVKGEIPSFKVDESKNFIAILDIMPINRGHTLVISKEHYSNIEELPKELGNELLEFVQKVGEKVNKGVESDGWNIGVNTRKAAGQVINHFHLHIIPRFATDNLKSWPQKAVSEEELKSVLESIKKAN